MKKLFIAFSLLLAMSFTTKSVQAQTTTQDFILAAGNLVNVVVSDVQVDILNDAVITVDVSNVLNNNTVNITALNNFLNNITIDNVLNNLLRNADIITNNQIVVGVLSNGTFLVADSGLFSPRKKQR